MWELVALQQPWKGKTQFDLMGALYHGEKLELSEEQARSCPVRYVALMKQCLSLEPNEWPTARKVTQQLQPVLHGLPEGQSRGSQAETVLGTIDVAEEKRNEVATAATLEEEKYLKLRKKSGQQWMKRKAGRLSTK